MTQLRDMENNHHEKLTEVAVTLLERMAKNQLDEDIHDDLKGVSQQSMNVITEPPIGELLGRRQCNRPLYIQGTLLEVPNIYSPYSIYIQPPRRGQPLYKEHYK